MTRQERDKIRELIAKGIAHGHDNEEIIFDITLEHKISPVILIDVIRDMMEESHKPETKTVRGTFTSVWDTGAVISSAAELNLSTGELTTETVDVDIDGVLKDEYFEYGDERLQVCLTCHNHILKTVMGDRADCSYGELQVCSDPTCESREEEVSTRNDLGPEEDSK